MGRLPFNLARLSRVQSGASAREGTGDKPLTVGALAARISEGISEAIPQAVRVVGELSGVTDRTHLYFDLKDQAAVVNCVMFASAARRSRYRPQAGQQVVVTGRVEFHARSGRVSLLVDRVEPVGVGPAEQAFRELFDELKGLGWFDPETKKRLPIDPQRVAVVTSESGAALQDVLDTMRRRSPAVDVTVVDVRVQGDRAVDEIVWAIGSLSKNRHDLGLDAMILTRGGGSKEDLAAFNDRRVAEAIYRCALPVVAAIGHETDTSIAELVADERAATPTQAAMRLTPDSVALAEQLDALSARLAIAGRRVTSDAVSSLNWSHRHLAVVVSGRLHESRARAERASAQIAAHQPSAILARRGERVRSERVRLVGAVVRRLTTATPATDDQHLIRAMGQRLRVAFREVATAEACLIAVNPIAVLERGFSITSRPDGTLVRRADQTRPGDRVVTRMADGRFESTVTDPDGIVPKSPPQTLSKPRKRSGKAKPDNLGMDLFGSGE